MTMALAKIWARRIYAGAHTIDEVEVRYGAGGAEMVRVAYKNLYGTDI